MRHSRGVIRALGLRTPSLPTRPRNIEQGPTTCFVSLRTFCEVTSERSSGGGPKDDASGARATARNDRSQLRMASLPKKATLGEQLKELKRVQVDSGGVIAPEHGLVAACDAPIFPSFDTSSLGGQTVVIQRAAQNVPVTLVLIAFRSFADEQLTTWRKPFEEVFDRQGADSGVLGSTQVFDVSVNETFAAQSLSGFVQRIQRGSIDESLHGHYVALNAEAGASLEAVLPSTNRLFGSALLLDRDARVRFRAAGKASNESIAKLIDAARTLVLEDERLTSSGRESLRVRRKGYQGHSSG